MRAAALAALVGVVSLTLSTGSASAEVASRPYATKVCAGFDGGGISWLAFLTHGWLPSKYIHYRIRLIDPRGVSLGRRYGTTGHYWDVGDLSSGSTLRARLEDPGAGTWTMIIAFEVDRRYPRIRWAGVDSFDWFHHAGQWIAQQYRIRVYSCR